MGSANSEWVVEAPFRNSSLMGSGLEFTEKYEEYYKEVFFGKGSFFQVEM